MALKDYSSDRFAKISEHGELFVQYGYAERNLHDMDGEGFYIRNHENDVRVFAMGHVEDFQEHHTSLGVFLGFVGLIIGGWGLSRLRLHPR